MGFLRCAWIYIDQLMTDPMLLALANRTCGNGFTGTPKITYNVVRTSNRDSCGGKNRVAFDSFI